MTTGTTALLRVRLLAWWRQLRSQAFELFVLGPIVGGGALLIADRYLLVGAPFLAGLLADPERARRGGLAVALFSARWRPPGSSASFTASGAAPASTTSCRSPKRSGCCWPPWPRRWRRCPPAWCGPPAASASPTGPKDRPLALGHRLGLTAWLAFTTLVLLDHLLLQLAVRLALLRAPALAAAGAGWLGLWIAAPRVAAASALAAAGRAARRRLGA